MESFSKVLRPGTLPAWDGGRTASVFLKIQFSDGRLSITGVHGPLNNGDAIGGCGQIVDSLEPEKFTALADGWTPAMVTQLREIWERWHLNDMRPECSHQRAAGWVEKARESVQRYKFEMGSEFIAEQSAAKKAALDALKAGRPFHPTPEQTAAAAREYWLYAFDAPEPPAGYKLDGHPERKTLGWLHPKEHPEGILTRPCPECGYKYGSAWVREDVPESVLEWLAALPVADRNPAWV